MIVVSSDVLVRRSFALGIAVSMSACVDGQAAQLQGRDVAMFRGGAARNGVYAAAAGQSLAGLQWRFVTEGDVMSSPTVLGQTVYIGSGDGRLYALDRTEGTKKWSFDASNPIASSPAVGNGAVYVGTRDGHFFAVDAASGKQRWKFATGPLMPWAWGHESGDVYTSSPA